MRLGSIIATGALALGMTTAAFAQDGKVIALDPESVVAFFFDNGIPAKLTTDSVGDPLIEFRNNGESMQVFFYDCENNTECLSLQFYSGYKVGDDVGLDVINAWNADRRFVRAYKTDEGAARIEMDVATSRDGITQRDFSDIYDLWIESTGLFEERIGWN